MLTQGVPVPESAEKFPRFTFYFVKSIAVTRARKCCFRWFSGGLYESAILNFFLIFGLCYNIAILRSLHRYDEY